MVRSTNQEMAVIEKNYILFPKRKEHVIPQGATQESIRVIWGQREKGKCGQEALLWFSQEGMGKVG